MKSFNTRALGLTLGISLVLAGGMTRIAQATDIGLDPSHLRLVYTVDGGPVPGEPIYKVEVPGAAGSNFNTSSTPFLLPCNVNRFGVDVVADSAAGAGNVPVYWAVTASFFQLNKNQTETQVVSHGCQKDTTFSSGTGDVIPVLLPGESAEAGFTPIDSADLASCQYQFQPTDLKRNYPVRMQLELHAYADSGFTTPIADTDSSNDVFNFWVMRANTGNCSH